MACLSKPGEFDLALSLARRRVYNSLKETHLSFTLHGIPVSRGIAIGRAYLIAPASLDVDHYLLAPEEIEAEVARFCAAQNVVHKWAHS